MTRSEIEFESEIQHEIGLRLPDGTEIWPGQDWHGRGVESFADRQIIVNALTHSADNLNISAEELLSKYQWAVRTITTYTTLVPGDVRLLPLDTPEVIQAPQDVVNGESPEPVDAEEVPEDPDITYSDAF